MPEDPFDEIAADYLDRDEVVMGRMIRSRGLKVRGKFICFRRPASLAVKLPVERVDELVGGGLVRFDRGDGRPMREWVESPDTDVDAWPGLLEEAYAFRLAHDA
ncbi:MAG: hypothetical protein HOQ22_00220 [Nocardioidaceae bacterium]|nr:hypothetical protein [Nocardioidaceae bacterium]NUS49452.1 hypothetical protein [Nocardioidaceae bacterium]